MRHRLVAVLFAVASVLCVSVPFAAPAHANDIRWGTFRSDCWGWDSAGATNGVVSIYVERARDYTPSPDQVRPHKIGIVNNTSNTMAVLNLEYYTGQGGGEIWSVYNQWSQRGGGQGVGQEGPSKNETFPSRPLRTPPENNLWFVSGPEAGLKAATHGPNGQPWWRPIGTNYTPFFVLTARIQGHTDTCFHYMNHHIP